MGYIIGLVGLFLGGVAYTAYKNILNPACFFLLLWGFVCILSQMKLFGFTGANEYGYILIGIGILSYGFGSFALLRKKKPIRFTLGNSKINENGVLSKSDEQSKCQVNEKALWAMMIIVLLYTLYKLKLALPFILMNNTLGYVRTIYLRVGAGITINALDYLINTFIITGMRLTCEIVIINELVSRRKIHKILIVILGSVIVMNVLLTGGRMILLDLCLYILFSVKLNGFKTKRRLSIWQKVVIFCLGVLIVYGMLYITKDRQGNNTVLESVYGNFIGGVSLFNTVVEDVLGKRWTYGIMFAYAVISLIWTPLNYFLHIPYPKAFDTFDLLVSPFYNVGKTTMNSYITCWAFFYSDYRIAGIIIFSMIFGAIEANYYNKYRMTRSAEDTCKYMLMLNVIFCSIIRWQLSNSSYLLTLALLSVVYKKKSAK